MQDSGEITGFADNLVAAVEKAVGHRLDTTPETLPFLDYYARIFLEAGGGEGSSGAGGKDDEISLLLAPMAGAYFGQVVRKRYACEWFAPHGRYEDWRIQFDHCFLFFNPVAVAMEVLNRREVEGWPSSFSMRKEDEQWICEMLDRWEDVRLDDYYTFRMRWEILDIIVNKLKTAEAIERGGGGEGKLYRHEDYEKFIRESRPGW